MQTENQTFQLPDGSRVELRPVSHEDDQFLLSLYASTREEELSQVEWAEGQREIFLRWQFDLQRREYESRFPDAAYHVILVDQHPAGRIWVGSDDEQIRLLDIALLPEFQNRGVGTALLRRLIDHAAAEGKVLRHMVFVLNNDAHRFYERLGFEIIDDLGAYKHMEWRPKSHWGTGSEP
jgi:GNAT superfamily N-acetyltransferase